jgi:response regulator RpfG family c-di-GMP phosphodiesterase
VILYGHHEHYDGSGYPDGLKGHEIPMAARIFTLIDSFVAMVAPVGDEDKKTIEEAKKELQACTGSQFDPVLVKILLNILEENNEYAIKEKRPINAAKE